MLKNYYGSFRSKAAYDLYHELIAGGGASPEIKWSDCAWVTIPSNFVEGLVESVRTKFSIEPVLVTSTYPFDGEQDEGVRHVYYVGAPNELIDFLHGNSGEFRLISMGAAHKLPYKILSPGENEGTQENARGETYQSQDEVHEHQNASPDDDPGFRRWAQSLDLLFYVDKETE